MPNYTLKDGVTLKNKLGITSFEELDIAETDYAIVRDQHIITNHPSNLEFDSSLLKFIHFYLFQDVYEWAGHTRDERVRLSDGTVATEPTLAKPLSRPFVPGARIKAELDLFSKNLSDASFLIGLTRDEFAIRAADLMTDLNVIHPFREGNGRTQRFFFTELAAAAGHTLNFEYVSKERMIAVSMGSPHDLFKIVR